MRHFVHSCAQARRGQPFFARPSVKPPRFASAIPISLLTTEPVRHVTYTREYLGWGVFALMAR